MEPSTIIAQLGFAGAVLVLWWFDRKDMEKKDREAAAERQKKEDADRLERQSEATLNRTVLTNHLSSLIGEDIASRENLAVALTKLSEGLNAGQKNCADIRGQFTVEVGRMKEALDKDSRS